VFQYRADLQAKGHKKLWLYKRCYEKKKVSSQLFNAISNSLITSHLERAHGIKDPGKNSSALSSSQAQKSDHPQPFNDLKYKKQVVNIFIKNDLSFTLIKDAEFQDTFISGRPKIKVILPLSYNIMKAWVLDYFKLRKIQIKDKVLLA